MRPPLAAVLFAAAMVVASGCVFDSERRPAVDVNLAVASSYVFRGQTMTAAPVAQADTRVQLPTKDGGNASAGTFGNLDLTDHRGDAWMDSGHAGEFTQIDLWAAWQHDFGAVDVALGARHYAWPNGETFRFAPFPSTSEAFAVAGLDCGPLHPTLTVHRDIDEVESVYVRGDLTHTIGLARDTFLELHAWLGWSDADHSRWLYRRSQAAFSDLGASAALRFDLDALTSVRIAVLGSTIVDSTLREWFASRIDADVVWVTASIGWAF